MPVRVAEYLGQSTLGETTIIPFVGGNTPECPFTHQPCIKLGKRKNQTQPVCSVAVNERLFPVCENRVLPSLKMNLRPVHRSQLFELARTLFPKVSHKDIRYGLQKTIKMGTTVRGERATRDQLRIDYLLRVEDAHYEGPSQCVVEVQAGGETSSTSAISSQVRSWATSRDPTNSILAAPIRGPGLIPNNAWKRTLEQVFRKAPLCIDHNGALALVLGSINFDYFRGFVRGGSTHWVPDWEIALIEMRDNWPTSGEVVFRPNRAVFMTYDQFVESVRRYPYMLNVQNPFNDVTHMFD